MILRLLCPSGHVLDVDAQLAGRKIRCGACGKIMVVPTPAKGPVTEAGGEADRKAVRRRLRNQQQDPLPGRQPRLPSKPPAAPLPRPIAKPPATPAQSRLRSRRRSGRRPSRRRQPRRTCRGKREWWPCRCRRRNSRNVRRRSARRRLPVAGARASRFSAWLRKLWPAAERHLPADATIPGKAERRIALQLAAVPAAAALVGLLPVVAWAMPIFSRRLPGRWQPCSWRFSSWSMPPG